MTFADKIKQQEEQAKNTKRSLETIYSPGTYFSESSSQITNNIMCAWIHVSNKFKSRIGMGGIPTPLASDMSRAKFDFSGYDPK
jgi:hypothetical protein